MSYEVLARKLRPMGFDALVGQDHVVRALRHALDAGRLHHAYLFTGTRGVGKTTIARIVAKSLNCEQGVSSSPCESCSVCTEIKENRFIDLIEVDAASRTGVDDTRDLLENAQYLPTRGRYKVYLIDEVHMLSTASFNALLKTLEEPPEHVKFLLATTDPKKVPVTVLSRCLQFQLKKLSREAITDYLAQVLNDEGVNYDDAALDVVARSAAGSMRDALSLTDQAIAYGQGTLHGTDVVDMLGVVGRNEVSSVLDALQAGSAQSLLQRSAELAARGADFSDVLKGLMEALHNLSVQAALGNDSGSFGAEELQLFYQIALIGYRDLDIAPDERSGFEMTMLRMLAFAPEQGSKVPSRSSSGPVDAGDDAADPSAENARSDTRQANQNTDDPPPRQQPASNDTLQQRWFELVAELPASGVTRMIAENSILLSMQLPEVDILLDEGHDTLLTSSQTQHLTRALEKVLGETVVLNVNTGEPKFETPAIRRAREVRQRQEEAEQAIAEDATVNGLLAEFGGRVDRIRPI